MFKNISIAIGKNHLKKAYFSEMRCKITTFCRNNQIFCVLLQKILFVMAIKNKFRTFSMTLAKHAYTLSIACIIAGVLLFVVSFAWQLKSNTLLYCGLLCVTAGTAGYVYSLRQE